MLRSSSSSLRLRSGLLPSLAGLLSLVGCVAPGSAPEAARLQQRMAQYDGSPVQVAAVVLDCATGARLFEREAQRLLRPASTMKLLPTAAVARRLADGKIETVLSAEPAGADGQVATVVLHGAGDPFLSTDELRLLVLQLAASGMAPSAEVKVVVVDPLFGTDRFGEGWMWDDEPSSFMPPLSAAPIDGGCVTVEVRRSRTGVLVAELVPTAGDLRVTVEHRPAAPGERPSPTVVRGRYRDAERITVVGDVAPGQTVKKQVSVPDPARQTGHVLAQLLRDQRLATGRVTVEVVAQREPAAGAITVAMARSVADALVATNKPSDNLGAELLLRRLGVDAQGRLDGAALGRGLEVVKDDLRALGLDPAGYRLADGSGVSHYSLLSAEALVAELFAMHRLGGAPFDAFYRSLPIAGVDGTLASRMKGTPAEGRVRAKTGTISGVSNLAGYVETLRGRRLAFVVMVQNFVGSAREWRELQDEVCAELVGW